MMVLRMSFPSMSRGEHISELGEFKALYWREVGPATAPRWRSIAPLSAICVPRWDIRADPGTRFARLMLTDARQAGVGISGLSWLAAKNGG
jgi:hypothetical protein